MQTTTYKCDRCGRESTDKSVLDLEEVCVGYRTNNYGPYQQCYTINNYARLRAEWCKKCREELCIREEEKKPNNSPIPTLEDHIREIVAEVVNNK